MGSKRIDAVLTQRSCEDGFTMKEIQELLEHLHLEQEEEVDVICLDADNCILFGFIRMRVSEEQLGFNVGESSFFGQAAIAVANDTELETVDGLYDFAGVKTYMYY